jgi:hypothetical protein
VHTLPRQSAARSFLNVWSRGKLHTVQGPEESGLVRLGSTLLKYPVASFCRSTSFVAGLAGRAGADNPWQVFAAEFGAVERDLRRLRILYSNDAIWLTPGTSLTQLVCAAIPHLVSFFRYFSDDYNTKALASVANFRVFAL